MKVGVILYSVNVRGVECEVEPVTGIDRKVGEAVQLVEVIHYTYVIGLVVRIHIAAVPQTEVVSEFVHHCGSLPVDEVVDTRGTIGKSP